MNFCRGSQILLKEGIVKKPSKYPMYVSKQGILNISFAFASSVIELILRINKYLDTFLCFLRALYHDAHQHIKHLHCDHIAQKVKRISQSKFAKSWPER